MSSLIRLSPSASVTVTDDGAVIRTDLGAVELGGPDIGVFLSFVLPLLDGSRQRAEIVAALDGYEASSVERLLSLLEQRGAIEEAAVGEAVESRWRSQELFFRRWPAAADGMRRLGEACVAVVGLEPWGAVAAVELARAGVGELQLFDDGELRSDDALASAVYTGHDLGCARREALRDALAHTAPWCKVTAAPITGSGARPDVRLAPNCGLVIGALPSDDMRGLMELARVAHTAQTRSLFAHLEGLDAVVGPVVVPGQTACWNCTRLRRLANAPEADGAYREQAALLTASPQRRDRTYLLPMPALLGHLVALEALKLLTGYAPSELVSRQLVQSLVSLQATFHAVVRLPWCEVCGGAADGGAADGGAQPPGGPMVRRLDEVDEPAELRELLSGYVDTRTGIVGSLALNGADARTPEIPFTASAMLSRFAGEGPPEPAAELGSGKALTAAGAMVGAVGEAIERYSAARYRHSDLRRARMDELDAVLDPRDLCLYAEHQYERPGFPFARVDGKRELDWVRGRWLHDEQPVWVPALVAFYNFRSPPSERFCQVTSNGLAAGEDPEDAALRATLELVERDAFTLSWLAKRPGRSLLVEGALDPEVGEIVRQLEAQGARIQLCLLDVGIPIPVIACLGLGDGKRWPGVTLALGAHLSPRVAVRKAIMEQAHVGPYVRRLMDEQERSRPNAAPEVRTLLDHALYHVPTERQNAVAFLGEGEPVALSSLPEPSEISLGACTEALSSACMRVAIVDVTSPDLLTSPFSVARALGVHAQPIHFGHGLERLANPRLERMLAGQPPNLDPHPLA